MTRILTWSLALLLIACDAGSDASHSENTPSEPGAAAIMQPSPTEDLTRVLDAQPPDVRERYRYRNPKATLEFFGIEPGMTVVEVLPGGGWYSKILVDYLGPDGRLIGADYALDMWPKFGFFPEEFLESKKTWISDWETEANAWQGSEGAPVSGFVLGAMPGELNGVADAVIMIRATHNLARFENQGGYLSQALSDVYDVLKPGGTVGVVQHWARDEMPDAWADGSRGYLKKGFVIDSFENAGFEYVDSSPVNQNDRDQPTEADVVWRLPPSLNTSQEDPELRQQMIAIGESNRMTLKFRKPG